MAVICRWRTKRGGAVVECLVGISDAIITTTYPPILITRNRIWCARMHAGAKMGNLADAPSTECSLER